VHYNRTFKYIVYN